MNDAIMLPVGGYLPQSLVDWPGRIAAVVYTSGCNFRCPFCHNPELVEPARFGARPPLAFDEVLGRIVRNRQLLGGVVVTGGEPTIHEALPDALRAIRGHGLAVRLDTNGSRPGMLGRLFDEGLVDEVAMDIKAPFEVTAYGRLIGIDCTAELLERILASVSLLRRSGVSCRFRSTYVDGLHTGAELLSMQQLFDGGIFFQDYRAGRTLAMTNESRAGFPSRRNEPDDP